MSIIWGNRVGPVIIKNKKLQYPYYSSYVEYTGEETAPEWINYNSDHMIMSGSICGVNKGHYLTTFTPKDGFCWEDGSTIEYSVEWTIFEKVLDYPEQSVTLTYNKKSRTPTWSSFDENAMIVSGDLSATNAGTYTCVFSLKEDCIWEDGSSNAYTTTWTINKAIGLKAERATAGVNPTTQMLYGNLHMILNEEIYGEELTLENDIPHIIKATFNTKLPDKMAYVYLLDYFEYGSGYIYFSCRETANYKATRVKITVNYYEI